MGQAEAASTETELLICRFQRGEHEAFDRLMALHTDKVFALAWGVLRNREDAIDAAQEVFIKLHASLPRLKPTDNLSAWLYRVCLNYCIDRKRRAKRIAYEMTEEDWERLQGSEQDEPEFRAYQSETGRVIREAVRTGLRHRREHRCFFFTPYLYRVLPYPLVVCLHAMENISPRLLLVRSFWRLERPAGSP